jgi:hypothetical protein
MKQQQQMQKGGYDSNHYGALHSRRAPDSTDAAVPQQTMLKNVLSTRQR